VTNALKTTKTQVKEALEVELKNVKDKITSEFEKAMKVADTLNIDKLNKSLKTQRDPMNVDL